MKFELNEEEFNLLILICGMGIGVCTRELPNLALDAIQLINKINKENPKWKDYNTEEAKRLLNLNID